MARILDLDALAGAAVPPTPPVLNLDAIADTSAPAVPSAPTLNLDAIAGSSAEPPVVAEQPPAVAVRGELQPLPAITPPPEDLSAAVPLAPPPLDLAALAQPRPLPALTPGPGAPPPDPFLVADAIHPAAFQPGDVLGGLVTGGVPAAIGFGLAAPFQEAAAPLIHAAIPGEGDLARVARFGLEQAALMAPAVAGQLLARPTLNLDALTAAPRLVPSKPQAVPPAPSAAAASAAPEVARARGERWVGPAAELSVDADRFQFKGDVNAQGMHAEMQAAKVFNPRLAKDLTLWRDPANSRLYVVNGHNRVGKALESGYAGNLEGDILDPQLFPSAESARFAGAVENIAEGRGTPLDAAKVFRDGGVTSQQLEDLGISLTGANARTGLGLAGLDDSLFRRVVTGQLSEKQGAIIGRELPDPAAQRALLPHLDEPLTDSELRHLINGSQLTPTVTGAQTGFGFTPARQESLAVPKAKLAAYIDEQLAREKRAFSPVAKEGNASLLRSAGNEIKTEANKARALGAAQLREVYQREIRHAGPVNDLLNDGARRIARGETPDVVNADTYRTVLDELRAAPGIDTGGAAAVGAQGPGDVPPALGLFDRSIGAILQKPAVGETGAVSIGPGPFRDVIDKDLRTHVEALAAGSVESVQRLRHTLNPVSAAEPRVADVLFTARGRRETQLFRGEQAMHEADVHFQYHPDEGIPFIARIQRGQAQPTAELQGYADRWRAEADELHRAINEFKPLSYAQDYFPGLWKDQQGFERWWAARRPLQGTQRFFKHKVFDDITEGVAAGFEPISDNPAVLMGAYRYDATKFLAAQEMWRDLGQLKQRVWVPEGQGVPMARNAAGQQVPIEGFRPLDDALARRYFPRDVAQVVIGGKATKRPVLAGRWWVQEDAARLLENSLSRDLLRENPAVRGVMIANGALNSVQLFGGWHATFVAIDSLAQENALALSRIAAAGSKAINGQPGAGADLLAAARHALGAPLAAPRYFEAGRRFFNAGQGTQLEQDLAQAGYSLRSGGQYYRATVWDNLVANTRAAIGYTQTGQYGEAAQRIPRIAVRMPFGIIQGAMKPLLNYAIPRIKVGALASLVDAEMERNAEALANGSITRATVVRNAGREIENRLGEVNYDNRGWNNTFKAGLQLAFRAVGFNDGTIRAIGGGIFQDTPVQIGRLLRGSFHEVELTPKMAYVLGLTYTVAAMGAVYTKLHTGNWPETLKDFFYWRNGEKDANGNDVRVVGPTYFKDFYGWRHHPIATIGHKLAPLPAMLWSVLVANRDYFGDYVYNEDAHLSTQARQVRDYLLHEVQPFSVQQFGRLSEAGGFTPRKVESMVGVMKAPAEMIESPRMAIVGELLRQQGAGRGPRTPEQRALDEQKRTARQELHAGGPSPAYRALVQEGAFSSRQSIREFLRGAGRTPQQRLEKRLTLKSRQRLKGGSAPPP